MDRAFGTTITCTVMAGVYGTAYGVLYIFNAVFSHTILNRDVPGYAILGLRGLAWVLFILTAICAGPRPRNNGGGKEKKEKKKKKIKPKKPRPQGNIFDPQPAQSQSRRIRSLFGDYDYPVSSAELKAEQDGNATSIPAVPMVKHNNLRYDPVAVQVQGHSVVPAQPLGVCPVFVYSLWFLAVPLLAIWSPHVLPLWVSDQCSHALEMLVAILGYIYFLAHCLPLGSMQGRRRCGAPKNVEVEHLTAL